MSLPADDSKDTSSEVLPTSPPAEDDEGLLRLDLYNSDTLIDLDNVFKEFESALSLQKAKLAAKWVSNYTKTSSSDPSKSEASVSKSKELLIDKKSVLKHISDIGQVVGRRFEELEEEQNKAIRKLEDILKFEEEARISRDKALQIQQETELEVKQIDAQRAVIANELAKAEPELVNARNAVSAINDDSLNELVSLKKPPITVSTVMTVAVWIIHSKVEPPGSGANKKNLKAPNSKQSGKKSPRTAKSPKFFDENGNNSPSSPNTPATAPAAKNGKNGNNNKNVGFKEAASKAQRPKSARNGKNKGARERTKSKPEKKKDILKLPWSEVRKLIAGAATGSSFKKQVLAFDPKTLAKVVCGRIEKEFLILTHFDKARAYKASRVLGPLVEWIRSLTAYGKIWYKIEPMATKVAGLEEALQLKTQEVEELQKTSEAMHAKVIGIRSEMLIMIGYKKIGDLYFLS